MTETPVTYAAGEGVAWITLDRPQVLNALDTALAATLADCVERAAADPAITLVIVRGAGRTFCSGMDRTALAAGAIACNNASTPVSVSNGASGARVLVAAPDLDAALEWGRKLAGATGLPIEVRPFADGTGG